MKASIFVGATTTLVALIVGVSIPFALLAGLTVGLIASFVETLTR